MNLRHCFSVGLMLATFGCGSAVAADDIAVTEAWVREGPPTSEVLAAYMKITNSGATDQAISGATSPGFERVEIHRTEVVDGMARMIPQDTLTLPAGETVALEPGGLHIMLITPAAPVRANDQVEIRLQLESGNCVTVQAEVRRADDGGMDHSHHHHH